MTFRVAADGYDRFIGRYSRLLAPQFLAFAGLDRPPVLDVGCGPGSLTEVLAARFGTSSVSAIDPSEPFVAACRDRVPGADVRVGSGESLPFSDQSFQAAVSQLVLSFVHDPDQMLREMIRVVRPGGSIAACTFEATGLALARIFWQAALQVDADAPDDARIPFRREHELRDLWIRTGLCAVHCAQIELQATYSDFDDFWSPFELGIGPAGSYFVAQAEPRRRQLRAACFELLGRPSAAFELPALVLAIRGQAPQVLR